MKAILGKAEDLTATARKLARIFYAMIKPKFFNNEALTFETTPPKKTDASSASSRRQKPRNFDN